MQTLCKAGGLRPERLDPNDYFRSLAAQAGACGLLTEAEQAQLQDGLLRLVARQAARWCKGESSSLPVERVQALLESVLFVLGLELKACAAPEQAVQALKDVPLEALFEQGLRQIRQRLAALRRRHARLADTLFETPSQYYRATAVDGIRGFFRLYRPEFAAQEIGITADYPLCLGRPAQRGIEFIERYWEGIEAENAFCRLFAPQDVHHLLCGLTPDYRNIPLNLFEPVLLAALGLTLLGRSPERLDLTGPEQDELRRRLAGQPAEAVQARLEGALAALAPRAAERYASRCLPALARQVRRAADGGTLAAVFLAPAYPEREPRLRVLPQAQLDSRSYRALAEAVLRESDGAARVELILAQVRSAADLVDLLDDGQLDAADIARLVGRLPGPDFALLLAQYPSGEFLTRRSERLLYRALQTRRRQLAPEQQRQLAEAVRALQNGEGSPL